MDKGFHSVHLKALARRYRKRWPEIFRAQRRSEETIGKIQYAIREAGITFSTETDLVICGSLARGEETGKSDVDWFILVNGPVSNTHLQVAKEVEKVLSDKGLQEPSKGGAFGNLVFSHELVHMIGGHSDTNNNMTQRLLLLFESKSLFNPLVREQVIRAILERYFEEETHFSPSNSKRPAIPRFLVNDVVRFWRTMCVDYASKHRTESGNKWALRNVKLRFSRKLIFSVALLSAIDCHLDVPRSRRKGKNREYIEHLSKYLEQSPLENLACFLEKYSRKKQTTLMLFDSYNFFLQLLDDETIRDKFKDMRYETAKADPDFNRLREVSHEFQMGLNRLFFKDSQKVCTLAQEYGVF